MNYRMIKYTLGWLLLFEAIFLTFPAIAAAVFSENAGFAFLITIGICAAVGAVGMWKKPKNTTLYSKDGFVIVALSWIVLSIFGSLPFIISALRTALSMRFLKPFPALQQREQASSETLKFYLKA